jgi:uroporphyrin-III C-methyltransferase/precorrin-2 dehydrogenase/sirohydrochlorin ferrochelatase
MGLTHLARIVAVLLAGGRAPATPAAVVQEGTTGRQRAVRAPLSRIVEAAAEFQPPAVVVIGAVVDTLPAQTLGN